ncbi:MAG: cytochrome c family protein [Aureliella sp.]
MHRAQDANSPELVHGQTVGYQECEKCHRNEAAVWKNTWHSTSYTSLHRTPEAKQIAARLGLGSVKYSKRCVQCHYTETTTVSNDTTVNAAVSCECCHGQGRTWFNSHFPQLQPGQAESAEDRVRRIANNISNGMRNRHNTYTMARICMRCHNIGDEELVNVGGHRMEGTEFEMVAWSQGLMRHRFLSGKGNGNAPNSAARLSLMFVSGIIADLEFSLRATANATSKGKFGSTAAKRCFTAFRRLESVQQKVDLELLEEIIDVFRQVQLKANNAEALNSAADQIRDLGIRFGAETKAQSLKPIQPFVPSIGDWVWK